MPIILKTEKKSYITKIIIFTLYLLLTLGATTMIYPFMITISSSLANNFDYNRFSSFPRSLHSEKDRFVRGLCNCFKDTIPREFFKGRPSFWTTWITIGDDYKGIDQFAEPYLEIINNPNEYPQYQKIAADYNDWFLDYDIKNTFCNYDTRDVAGFIQKVYIARFKKHHPEEAAGLSQSELAAKALEMLDEEWGVPYQEYFDIKMEQEIKYPMHHPTWVYPDSPKAQLFLDLKDAYRKMEFDFGAEKEWRDWMVEKGIRKDVPWPVERNSRYWSEFKEFAGQSAPATPTTPFNLKKYWLLFLNELDVKQKLQIPIDHQFTVDVYNDLFGTDYQQLEDTPFPVPKNADPKLLTVWEMFIRHSYPARLIDVRVTDKIQGEYRKLIMDNFKTPENYNKVMASIQNQKSKEIKTFADIRLPIHSDEKLWMKFIRKLPLDNLICKSAENSYQQYLDKKYGGIGNINKQYGWKYSCLEEISIPFPQAYSVTFNNHQWQYYSYDMAKNYFQVIDYLFLRGRAFINTLILIFLTIFAALTVNPLAAYSLSRFNLKLKEQILLFLLATMAFPAAVSAIPGFLLMRDLHILNTYLALILPTLANGMSIFILKCFFDGLPRELYEAADIDGASEWQKFIIISLPLVKPILAINCLTAFIAAYNSWAWALLVCQEPKMWTLAVWLYQMQFVWREAPYLMMAGFVLASIPTAIVFISCQKVILRGIVIPSMK